MISIIIPFYNTEKYIEECLNSVKIQTFSDFECLLIDDGSTDKSREITQKFVDEDSRFKLLGDKHIGFPYSKNLGLDNAKGDYICFIDSDDYVDSDYLEILYNNLINTNSDISCCDFLGCVKTSNKFPNDNIETFDTTISILKRCLKNTFMWNKLYKKEMFNGLRFEDTIALSDTMLIYKVFEKANKTVYTKYRGYHYRSGRENSISYLMRTNEQKYVHRLNVYLDMCNYLSKYPELKQYLKSTFRSQYIYCSYYFTKEQIEEFNNKEEVKHLLNSKNSV